MNNPALHNPQLEGEAFFWEAGPLGVLLCHGFTATTAEVRLFARRLYESGYTVAGPLLAGHGTRPEDLNRVRWQDWVASAENIYGRMKSHCRHVFLSGVSMGGLVALALASSHPEAAGTLLFAPAIQLTMSRWERIQLYAGARFLTQVPRQSLDVSDKWQGYPGLPLRGAVQLLQMQAAVRKLLPQIRQPIAVFQGRKDVTVHPDAGKLILSQVASTMKEQHWLEETSHPMLIDRELDRIVELSQRFMERALLTQRQASL